MNILILATRLVIASTGAMLIVGHEAPCRISALACRIESRDYTDKQGNSRQVSGTSDASKTQSMLIGTYVAGLRQTATLPASRLSHDTFELLHTLQTVILLRS